MGTTTRGNRVLTAADAPVAPRSVAGGTRALSARVKTGTGNVDVTDIAFGFIDCSAASDVGNGALRFSGNAVSDFAALEARPSRATDVLRFEDTEVPDVGVPRALIDSEGAPRVSGFDMRQVYLAYSAVEDRLYLAVDCFGVCGDADGDGVDGQVSYPQALIESGGGSALLQQVKDFEALGGTETFTWLLDVDEDNSFDIVIGVPAASAAAATGCVAGDLSCLGVYQYIEPRGAAISVSRFYGPRVLFVDTQLACVPSASCPDLELSVSNFLLGVPGLRVKPYAWSFNLVVFAGSFDDGGIGEDFITAPRRKPISVEFQCPAEAYFKGLK